MYLIKDKYVNGVHSFWDIGNKLIPTIKLVEQRHIRIVMVSKS